MTTRAADALIDLMFDGSDSRMVVRRTLDCMEIAEAEITRVKKLVPRKAAVLHASFCYLQPDRDMLRFSDEVYRAHVRELLSRRMRGDDVDLGTHAECLIALSEQSLKAPLSSEFAHAMSTCFARCFPDKPFDAAGHEAYKGSTDEILRELRRKLTRKRLAA